MRAIAITLVVWVFLAGVPALAQESAQPVESGVVEKEHVQLIILDVVVVDRQGRTVSDLTIDDFEVVANGEPVPVGSLDVSCPDGAVEEPRAVRRTEKRDLPDVSEATRRIVFAIDYLHIPFLRRTEVLEAAQDVVRHGTLPGDEIMVVALNGGLRIEQPFSRDPEKTVESLRRMEYDITLWEPDYFHLHESVFVDPMVALLDLLGQWPGNKAVVLFSEMADLPLDTEFARIAAIAAASRCSIYPVHTAGMSTPIGSSGVG
jgi:VWFA-related protein